MAQADLVAKIDGIEKFQRERTTGGEKKPQWPSQEKCAGLKNQIKEVLAAVGAKGAYISDVSMFGDFEGLWGVTEETPKADADRIAQEKCKEISLKLGLDEVKPTDYIVEVAEKLKAKEKTKPAIENQPQVVVQSHNEPITKDILVVAPRMPRTCGNGCGCK